MTTAAVIIEKVSFSLLDKCDNNPFWSSSCNNWHIEKGTRTVKLLQLCRSKNIFFEG